MSDEIDLNFPLRSSDTRVVGFGTDATKFDFVEKHRLLPPPKEEGTSSVLWSFDLETGTVSLDSFVGKASHHSCIAYEMNGVRMKVKAMKAQEKARVTLAKRRAKGGAGGK
jgi:hypothetical protein